MITFCAFCADTCSGMGCGKMKGTHSGICLLVFISLLRPTFFSSFAMYLFSGNQIAQMAWSVTWRHLKKVEERLGQRFMPPLHVLFIGRIRSRQYLQVLGQFFGRLKIGDTNNGVGVGQKVVHVGSSPSWAAATIFPSHSSRFESFQKPNKNGSDRWGSAVLPPRTRFDTVYINGNKRHHPQFQYFIIMKKLASWIQKKKSVTYLGKQLSTSAAVPTSPESVNLWLSWEFCLLSLLKFSRLLPVSFRLYLDVLGKRLDNILPFRYTVSYNARHI